MSQQINLYNPLLVKRAQPFSARSMAAALGLVVLATVLTYGYARTQFRMAESLANEARRQVAAQRDQVVKLAKSASQVPSKVLEAEVARLETEVRHRESVLASLGSGELGNTEGFSRFLEAFGRRALDGVWLTGFSVGENGNDLQVNGRVLRPELVPAYLRALSEEAVMRGRRVTELKLTARESKAASPGRYVEFGFSAPLRLAESAKPAAKRETP